MIIKITTDCNYAGCQEVHFVQVPDDIAEGEILQMVDEYIQNDIQPDGSYEKYSDEEGEELADEEGYDID